MHIAMIGGSYVGLVSGAWFAEFGTDVATVEADPTKLEGLRNVRRVYRVTKREKSAAGS